MTDKTAQSESMLVRSENLDQLLILAGDVIIASSNLGSAYQNLQNLYDHREAVTKETLESIKDLATSTTDISSNLHHLVQDIRTVDMKDLCFRAKRLVRDLARKTGKRVRFDVQGESTVVDKSIIEKLYDPIEHQLRNAVDHGIEDAAAREAAGKPGEGVIRLNIFNTERETFIEIEDDGAGLDMEALRRKAVAAGAIQDGDPFTEEDALEIMCAPGVSTARLVTQVSGRGVGMDVVRSRLHELGGVMAFTTARGQGTRFTFRVPLVSAVNIVDALVVNAADTMYAFPISAVVATASIERSAVHSTFGRGESITYLNELLPFFELATILGCTASKRNDANVSVLIIEHKENRIAFCVDAFLAPQKLVVIPIQETLPVSEFSGATIMGGRKLGFIVNVSGIITRALNRKSAVLPGSDPAAASSADAPETSRHLLHEQPEQIAQAQEETEALPQPERSPSEHREFLLEIERLIPALNEALFSLESNPQAGDPVNLAFRLFHTIKGNFMMIGLPTGGATIHSVESVLDRVRNSQQPATPEIMDILMDGASFIEEAVRASLAGTWTDQAGADIEERATVILNAMAPPEQFQTADSDEIVLSHEAAYRAVIHRKRRVPLYLCLVEFDSGPQPAFLIASLIYRRFCDFGDVLGTRPSLPEIEKGFCKDRLRVRFASALPQKTMEQALTKLLREHYGATTVSLQRFE